MDADHFLEASRNDPDPPDKVALKQLFGWISRKRCCCLLWSDAEGALYVGTGTAALHRERLFILTCHHNVDTIETDRQRAISFDEHAQVDGSQVELIWSDKDLDLALLRVKPAAAGVLTGIAPLSIEDIGNDAAFAEARPGTSWDYCLTGIPRALAKADHERKLLQVHPFVCPTRVAGHNGPARLELEYEHAVMACHRLDPRGISGSAVFELHGAGPDELWKPGRAIAIQHRWDTVDQRLICSSIAPLRQAIIDS